MSTKPVVNGSKTAVKPTAKPVAKVAAKPVAKAAVKPTFKATAKPVPKAPELKIKVGQEIKVRNTRNGNMTTGRFVAREKVPGAAGDWVKYNVAPKGKPAEFKLARAGQVVL